MRSIVIFLGLLAFTTPAYALSERAVDFCFSTTDPKACLALMVAEEQANQRARLEEHLTPTRDLEPPRNNLVPLGAAPAFINGMNQGFHQMQVPYVCTPQFGCPTSPR